MKSCTVAESGQASHPQQVAPHQVDRTAPAVPQGRCLGCGRHRFRGPVKGLSSKANPAWLKTAGVLMFAEAQKHGKSPANDERGQQLDPATAPQQGACVSFLLRKGYIHSYILLHVYTLTHNKHESPRTHVHTQR